MTKPVDRGLISLAQASWGFVLLSCLVLALAGTTLFLARSDDVLDEALDVAVRKRTEAAGQEFARRLHSDWADLKYLAGEIDGMDPEALGHVMAGMRGDGTRISWIGFAGADGEVQAASAGMLVGADVSERPWFRNGLRSGFAGDVHDAVLLARILRPDGGEPLRFVDLALPVKNANGEATGVLGMHIDAGWAEGLLREVGQSLGIDLYLIAASGEVVMATDGTLPGPQELMLLASARSGIRTAGREEWPDGHEYFTTLVPQVAYADLPNFGWRLAGRLDAQSFRPGLRSLGGAAALAAVLALVALAALTALFVRIYIRPIGSLVDSATRLAADELAYPRERNSTREAALLSAALARLQARRKVRGP